MLHCIFSNRVVIVNVHNWNEDIRDETEEALASNPLMFASMLLLGVNFPMASSKGMGGLPFSGAYFLSKATTHVCTSLPLPRARQPQVTAPEAAHTLSRRLSALTAPLMWPSRSSEVDSPPFFATGCPGSVRASAAGPGMASLCISYILSVKPMGFWTAAFHPGCLRLPQTRYTHVTLPRHALKVIVPVMLSSQLT